METVTERETSCCATLLSSLHVRRRGAGSMEAGPLGALPLHREPLLPCVAILCVDLSKHDKFVQVKNKVWGLVP